jgi:hypothetical protein
MHFGHWGGRKRKRHRNRHFSNKEEVREGEEEKKNK